MEPINILNKVVDRQNLSAKEVQFFLNKIVKGEVNASQIAAFLVALRTKGETVEEIAGLIEGMRSHMVLLEGMQYAVDTCGTGGDGAGTFNISTTVALVCAGAGVTVAKHGNRAASSQCGSADVLEALGVNIILKPEQAILVAQNAGMVFLFAPLYHPAMKHIAPIRKDLGIRTIFNYLGPFLNPAGVKRQLIGVPSPELAEKLANVAATLGYDHAIIASSKTDEIAISEPTKLYEIKRTEITTTTVDPQQLGFKKAAENDLQGGDANENAAIITAILDGKKGAARDIVVLNSAYVLYVSGKAKTVEQGIEMAEASLDTGAAKKVLEKLIQQTKKYE